MVARKCLSASEPQEASVADEPTASKTLDVIGVELYRLHRGPATAAINMVFAVLTNRWPEMTEQVLQ